MPKIVVLSIILLIFLFFNKSVYAAFDFAMSEQSITDTGELTVSVTLDLSSSTGGNTYFLRGAFFKEGTTKYFGYTINDQQSSYNGPYSACQNLYQVTVDENGDWSGDFKVKADPESSYFEGSGEYLFKVGRYTSGCSLTWADSDPVKISIIQTVFPEPSPSPTISSSTSTKTFSKSPSPSPKSSPSPTSSKKTNSVLGSSQSAEITRSPGAGISLSVSPTPSAEPKVNKSSNKIKIAGAVAGSGAIVMGVSVGLYLWYKRSFSTNKRRITKNNSDKESI